MIGWFDAREAEQLGRTLAAFYAERIPVDERGNEKKLTDKKQQDVLNKLFAQAQRSGAQHKLNVYKKAKLGNVFKWQLKDQGFDGALVDELTKELLLRL